MLRASRSRVKSRWPADGERIASTKLGDLEKAPLPHNPHRSNRSRLDIPSKCTSVRETVVFIFLLLLLVSYLGGRRTHASSGDSTYWRTLRTRENLAATTSASFSRTLKPKGRPLQPSSLDNPPRVDRMKLFGRLSKLEASIRDEDLNEDIDEVADDLRQIYGLSRWPPLISRVPSVSGHVKEEYTTKISDELLCSSASCKLLLPIWTRPLTPSQQLVQVRQLVDVAIRLGRTLVLPNAGPVDGDAEELLNLGTCHRNPIARYFDVSELLLNRFGRPEDDSPKLAVPMHSFSEWVKYRPIRPSAQVVVVESSPSNETHVDFSLIEGAEVRTGDWTERGKGKYKNCLSSKASKLAFANQYAFIITPEATQSASQLGSGQPDPNLRYIDGIISFLAGDAGTSGEESCSTDTGPFHVLEDPDVLVMEWDLGIDLALDALPNVAERDGAATLGYSPRLHLLAANILSTMPKSLIILRSKAILPTASNMSRINFDLEDPKDFGSQLQDLLRDLYPETSEENALDQEENALETVIDTDNAPDDSLANGTENSKCASSFEKLGTIWFGSDLTQKYSSLFSRPAVPGEEPDGSCSSGFPVPAVLDGVANGLFDEFSLADISVAISQLAEQNQQTFLSLGKNAILDDKPTRIILENIIEQHADRVVMVVGNEISSDEKEER